MTDRSNALALVKPVWMKQAEEAKQKTEAEKAAAAKAAFDATFKDVDKAPTKDAASSDSEVDEGEGVSINKPIGPVDSSKCSAAGAGIAGGAACTLCTFVVVTKDADGRKVSSGGSQINVKVLPGAGVGGSDIEGVVQDMNDGSYTVTYAVPKRGDYMVHVDCNGKPIMGSPFPVFFSASSASSMIGLSTSSPYPNLVNQTMPNMPNYSGSVSGAFPGLLGMIPGTLLGASGGVILPGIGSSLGEICREFLCGRCSKTDCKFTHPPQNLLMTALAATTSMGTLSQTPMAPSAAAMAAAQAIVAAQALQAHAAQMQAQSSTASEHKGSSNKDKKEDSLSKTVQVSNLSPLLTVEQLKQLFGFCGTVAECIITESKHFAYVVYSKPEEATAALALNNMDVGGRPINVEKAKALPLRPSATSSVSHSSLPMVMQQAVAMQQLQFQQALLMQQTLASQQAASRAATMKTAIEMASSRAAEISKKLKADGVESDVKEVTQKYSKSPSPSLPAPKSRSRSPCRRRHHAHSRSPSASHHDYRSRSPARSHYPRTDHRRSYVNAIDGSRGRKRERKERHEYYTSCGYMSPSLRRRSPHTDSSRVRHRKKSPLEERNVPEIDLFKSEHKNRNTLEVGMPSQMDSRPKHKRYDQTSKVKSLDVVSRSPGRDGRRNISSPQSKHSKSKSGKCGIVDGNDAYTNESNCRKGRRQSRSRSRDGGLHSYSLMNAGIASHLHLVADGSMYDKETIAKLRRHSKSRSPRRHSKSRSPRRHTKSKLSNCKTSDDHYRDSHQDYSRTRKHFRSESPRCQSPIDVSVSRSQKYYKGSSPQHTWIESGGTRPKSSSHKDHTEHQKSSGNNPGTVRGKFRHHSLQENNNPDSLLRPKRHCRSPIINMEASDEYIFQDKAVSSHSMDSTSSSDSGRQSADARGSNGGSPLGNSTDSRYNALQADCQVNSASSAGRKYELSKPSGCDFEGESSFQNDANGRKQSRLSSVCDRQCLNDTETVPHLNCRSSSLDNTSEEKIQWHHCGSVGHSVLSSLQQELPVDKSNSASNQTKEGRSSMTAVSRDDKRGFISSKSILERSKEFEFHGSKRKDSKLTGLRVQSKIKPEAQCGTDIEMDNHLSCKLSQSSSEK